MLLTWEELQAVDFGETDWWVEDLIPAGGTVLVWGKESIGKTPICWYLARSIASGESFFGYNAKRGRVLFIELDMPPRYTQKRLRNLPLPDGVSLAYLPSWEGVDLRVTIRDRPAQVAAERLQAAVDVLQPPLGEAAYGADDDDLAALDRAGGLDPLLAAK